MTDYFGTGFSFHGDSTLSVADPEFVGTDPIAMELNGVALNQNVVPANNTSFVSLDNTNWIFQTFKLPSNFPRGEKSGEIRIPDLCGLDVYVGVIPGRTFTVGLDWRIDWWTDNWGWTGLAQGTRIGAPADGDAVWLPIDFEPQNVEEIWQEKFRFGISARPIELGAPFQLPVDFDGTFVDVDGDQIQVVPDINSSPLEENRIYVMEKLDGTPGLLNVAVGSGDITFSVQQGVDRVWYCSPNPLATKDLKASSSVGDLIRDNEGNETSLRFRIRATAPDADLDCLGNSYRTVVQTNPPTNVTNSNDDLKNAFWLSKPNPSQFAVESLYFDLRDGNQPQVVDSVVIDPATPGVYFHVYYSNDPIPGTTPDEFDRLLWKRVNQTFLMKRRESFTLPTPITAKFIKIEFTQLQPRYYAPGSFQIPMKYKKHPRWVLDFYLALYQHQRAADQQYASVVQVTYDALDLAYNYFLDDIRQTVPNAPDAIESAVDVSLLTNFLKQENNEIDPDTLLAIQMSFQPFTNTPSGLGRFGDILHDYASISTTNYSTEVPSTAIAVTDEVSSLNRESVVVEKGFPVTSFYLTCRHKYRLTQAAFENDKAYFVGVKEVAFTREHYAVKFDNPLYIETTGDAVNTERLDFETVNETWVTYSDAS